MLYRVSRQIQLDKIFWYTQRLLRFDKLIYTNEILFRNFHWPTTRRRRRRGYDIHPDACDSSTPLHCLLCVRVFPINVKHSELAPHKTPTTTNWQSIDYEEYYTNRDPALLVSNFTANLAFLANNWRHMLGRPTITLISGHYLLGKFKSAIFP